MPDTFNARANGVDDRPTLADLALVLSACLLLGAALPIIVGRSLWGRVTAELSRRRFASRTPDHTP